MFFLSWMTSIGIFYLGRKLRSISSGWLSLFSFICFLPFLNIASQVRLHWFVLPAIIAVCLFCSENFRNKSHLMTGLVSVAILIGMLAFIRNTIIFLIIVPIFHLAISLRFNKYFFIYTIFLIGLSLGTKVTLDRKLVSLGGTPSNHTVWFPIYVGLGELPIKFTDTVPPLPDDTYGFNLAIDRKIKAEFGTPEWDLAFKSEVISLFRQRPDVFLEMFKE